MPPLSSNQLECLSQGAVSNLLQPRLDAVKFFLNRLTEGKPAYIISLDGCPTLRAGMYGKYIYRLVHRYGEKMPAKEPDKTHPISDIQDAQQYICLRLHDSLNTPTTTNLVMNSGSITRICSAAVK